jgi:hypothetical protein
MSDVKSLTLYQIESDLAAMLDTEALVPEEYLAAFQAELAAKTEQGMAKRANCIRAIRHIEHQIELASSEEKRLAEWRRSLSAGLDRFKDYIVRCIELTGSKKVEADNGSLSIQSNPESVEITDLELVPDEFKTVTVKMPAALWREIVTEYRPADLTGLDATFNPNKSAIKDAIKSGREIPGCDLRWGKNRLNVR